MSRTIKLIFNPHADNGRAWNLASTLRSMIEEQGSATWASTGYPGHAKELTIEAARAGAEVVAALGGDGTVHEVVNGLMQIPKNERPLLAIVPLGSGNDFANNLGVDPILENAMNNVFSGTARAFDIGSVTDDNGRIEYWDNTMGIGFDASATIRAARISRLRGFPMYLLAVIQTILQHHDIAHMKMETENGIVEQDILMLTICNGPREGGGFHVAPGAKTTDGILDYALIEGVSRLMMFRLIPEVMKGTHGRFRQVKLGQLRKATIEYDRPLAIHTDGEIFTGFSSKVRQLTIEVHPSELQVLV